MLKVKSFDDCNAGGPPAEAVSEAMLRVSQAGMHPQWLLCIYAAGPGSKALSVSAAIAIRLLLTAALCSVLTLSCHPKRVCTWHK